MVDQVADGIHIPLVSFDHLMWIMLQMEFTFRQLVEITSFEPTH